MADEATQRIAALLLGQQNPSLTDMWRYIDRNPDLAAQNQGQYIGQPFTTRPGLSDEAAVADPMGFFGLQRLLGSDLAPQARINEGHGLINKENRRLWDRK